MNKIERKYWDCRNWFRDKLFEPVWYKFFGHKHHLVKTKLHPCPWIDADARMLYAVMALVEWFVENDQRAWTAKERQDELDRIEKEEQTDFRKDMTENLKDQWAKDDGIKDIYYWWKSYDRRQEEIRMALHEWHNYVESKIDPKSDSITAFMTVMQKLHNDKDEKEAMLSKKHDDLERALESEEQEMLKKAVELRGSMWS